MLPTTKIWLFTKRMKKNGKYPVKIKIIYQRYTAFYPTGVDLTKEEFSVVHTKRSLKAQFEDIMYFKNRADEIIGELKYSFTWKEFDARYYNRQPTSKKKESREQFSLLSSIQNYAKQLKAAGQISSCESYTSTYNHLSAYLGSKSKDILFSEVTPEYLAELEIYLLGEDVGLSHSSVGIYMRNIRSIYNRAIAEKRISSEHYPFGRNKYTPPATKRAKKAMKLEEIEKLYNYQPEDPDSVEAWAKDMWFFGYFCSGMNLKDIALLRYDNFSPEKNSFTFIREKTKKSSKNNLPEIEVAVTEDISRIIAKWGNKKVNGRTLVFDILNPKEITPESIRKDVNLASKKINKYIKRIAENLELSVIPTAIFARHSFSTVLKKAGVPIAMISEQLGHASISTTEIYLGSFETEQKRELAAHLTSFKQRKK